MSERSEIKYTPGRLHIEIDGVRLTMKGYCGGACVQAEERFQQKCNGILQRIADTYNTADHLEACEAALRASTKLLRHAKDFIGLDYRAQRNDIDTQIATNEVVLGGGK